MANPLTLYLNVKQDAQSQAAVATIVSTFQAKFQELMQSNILHYARLSLVPGPTAPDAPIQAFMVITTFDGPMNPYLQVFYSGEEAFQALASAFVQQPSSYDLTGFQNWINDNNLNPNGDPSNPFFEAYTFTVEQILGN
jgi:hypothetical protein